MERLFWDLYAISYSMIPKTYKPYQEVMAKLNESIVSRKNNDNEIILDSGCGVGAHAKMLYEEGFSVVGLDFCEAMVRRSKKHAKEASFMLSDMQEIPLGDESVDHIVSVNALYVVPDPDKVLSEWNRILKPGGYLHLISFAEPLNIKEMNKEYLQNYGSFEYVKMFTSQFFNGICGLVIQNKMEKGDYHYWDEEIHKDKLTSNGFEIEQLDRTYICNYDIHSISRKSD